MSQNNLPTTLSSIEKLLQRISAADKSNQKEIRISIQEARDLAIDLALLTSRLAKTVSDINQSLNQIKNSTTDINVQVDGGGFKL